MWVWVHMYMWVSALCGCGSTCKCLHYVGVGPHVGVCIMWLSALCGCQFYCIVQVFYLEGGGGGGGGLNRYVCMWLGECYCLEISFVMLEASVIFCLGGFSLLKCGGSASTSDRSR